MAKSTMADFFARFRVQTRIMHALALRELMTRFGRHNLGFFWLMGEPLILCLMAKVWAKGAVTVVMVVVVPWLNRSGVFGLIEIVVPVEPVVTVTTSLLVEVSTWMNAPDTAVDPAPTVRTVPPATGATVVVHVGVVPVPVVV